MNIFSFYANIFFIFDENIFLMKVRYLKYEI
jgi:hypothetical protein